MKRFLREYFTFSRSEARVMFILSCLIFLSFIVRVAGFLEHSGDLPMSPKAVREVEDFVAGLEHVKAVSSKSSNEKQAPPFKMPLKPDQFNPNTVQSEELLAMGLSNFVVRNLVKYRNAGGRFLKPVDFAGIYGLTPEQYTILEPYITIPKKVRTPEGEVPKKKEISPAENFSIEINSASGKDFERLNGIGEVLAGRIIKFRNLLGGFASAKQLGEVYGVSDSLVEVCQEHFRLDTAGIRKISLNDADFSTLLRHPYLRKPDVQAIFKFREFSKKAISPADLSKAGVIPDSIYRKILPYLQK
ncbi:MAG TPA: helix-hairpin-helix domain-containing protein [Bacteroidales bacterium]|nr:helix-hairpin-helix domain-containing protein [Bacteroidales bacterium]